MFRPVRYSLRKDDPFISDDDISKNYSYVLLAFSIAVIVAGVGNYLLTSRGIYNSYLAS